VPIKLATKAGWLITGTYLLLAPGTDGTYPTSPTTSSDGGCDPRALRHARWAAVSDQATTHVIAPVLYPAWMRLSAAGINVKAVDCLPRPLFRRAFW